MFDNRDLSQRSRCRNTGHSCTAVVAWILTALFFFVVGAIVGAYAAAFVTAAIVPIAIFAIILFLALVFTAYLAHCNDRR